jgi:hypothetical protein
MKNLRNKTLAILIAILLNVSMAASNSITKFQCSWVYFTNMLLAPGKGFEPLRARSPPAFLPFGLSPLLYKSRGWRDNHSATPAPA